MATGSEVSTVPDWSAYARAYIDVTTSSTSTEVSYSYFACLQMLNYVGVPYQYISVDGWSDSGYANGDYPGGGTWFNSSNFRHSGSGTIGRAKEEKRKTITVTCSSDGAWFYDYQGISRQLKKYTTSASYTVVVPPLESWYVTFNANGGSGGPSVQKKWYGEAFEIPSTVPTRNNYEFLGWATSKARADAKIVDYDPGDTYSTNAALILYAVWKRTGSVRKKVAGSWKMSQPYIKVNGSWKPAVSYIKVNGSWKEGT